MPPKIKESQKIRLHPRNRNRERYDLTALVETTPELAHYIKPNKYGGQSVEFANPTAVKLLNQALLNYYYGIKHWDFPAENLCPPIPGRADYIHHVADLLSEHNAGIIPVGDSITCWDIGVGANCIYPIIGVTEYKWNFIGTDIDPKSIASAKQIVEKNPSLKSKITCRLQNNPKAIFRGVINEEDTIDIAVCNPPFHASAEEAQKGTRRKVRNLSGKNKIKTTLNFGGVHKELIYEGGEFQFIQNMIRESKEFATNFFWFSTIVSKQANLKGIYKSLEKVEATQVKTIPMNTSNKTSRIVAWTFLAKAAQKEWVAYRWR